MSQDINWPTLENGVKLPPIGYGTGVVRKYSRNKPLFAKVNIRCVLSSIKHMRLNKQLQMNLYNVYGMVHADTDICASM